MLLTTLPLNTMVLAAILVFARVGACLMVMPGLSSPRVPLSLRLFLSLACALAVLPMLLPRFELVLQGAEPWTLARFLLSEMMIGAMIGLLAQVYFWALQFMANMVAMAIGFSGAPGDAIVEHEPQAVLATIITFSALLLFFATDMHLELFRGLLSSYAVIPVDGSFRPDSALADLTDALSAAFIGTLRIAAPFIVFAILVNVAIGLINKLTPAIPVYFISMPFVLGGGLLLIYFLLPEMLQFFVAEISIYFREMF